MKEFRGREATLAYDDTGKGAPIILLHGFASHRALNWISTFWFETLTQSGYRVIAPDLRGHGESTKFYEPEKYHPEVMASDILDLMKHLRIERADLMGYSMGGRLTITLAQMAGNRFRHLIAAGVGETLVRPVDKSEDIARSLLGQGPDEVPPGGKYRSFAKRHKGDLEALAACIRGFRQPFDPQAFKMVTNPLLIVAGSKDIVSGHPEPLSALCPSAQAAVIPNRDHMMTVADMSFKRLALKFLRNGE